MAVKCHLSATHNPPHPLSAVISRRGALPVDVDAAEKTNALDTDSFLVGSIQQKAMAHGQEPKTKIEYVLFDMDGLLMYVSRLSNFSPLLGHSTGGSATHPRSQSFDRWVRGHRWQAAHRQHLPIHMRGHLASGSSCVLDDARSDVVLLQ